MGLPGGPGAPGGQQRQEHEVLHTGGLLPAAHVLAQHGHRGGHGQLPVLGAAGGAHLALGVAGHAVGVLVAGGGAPGGELGARLVGQAQVHGDVVALPVDRVHGGPLGAEEGLHAVLQETHLLQAHPGVGGRRGHDPLVVPHEVVQAVVVEEVGALGLPGQAPHEGGHPLPVLPPPLVGVDELQAGDHRGLLVLDGVRPGHRLGHQGGAGRAVGQGVGLVQAVPDVLASGHGRSPLARRRVGEGGRGWGPTAYQQVGRRRGTPPFSRQREGAAPARRPGRPGRRRVPGGCGGSGPPRRARWDRAPGGPTAGSARRARAGPG